MRKLTLLVVGALVALTAPSPAPAQLGSATNIVCNKTFQVSQGAVALTKVVSGAVGSSISICGWAANAGAAAGTFQFAYGTGTNCATGTVNITPTFSLGINGVLIDHNISANIAVPSVNSSGVANDLCLVTTGTGPTAILLYYFQ